MHNDDAPVGQLLTRRNVLTLLGLSGAGAVLGFDPAATAAPFQIPACVARPVQTEGPYFVEERLNRSDIRADPASGAISPGTLLQLTFAVSRVTSNGCAPVPGAQVDVWHCDAAGVYSDVKDPSFNTVGKKFLRGYQVTDAAGKVTFATIYPGWYQGRAVHIHFKIRTDPAAAKGYEFVSQVYFDERLNDRVHAKAPYARQGKRTRNSEDGIFRDGGKQLMLPVSEGAQGLTGLFELGLQI